jgi:hypothetical protein
LEESRRKGKRGEAQLRERERKVRWKETKKKDQSLMYLFLSGENKKKGSEGKAKGVCNECAKTGHLSVTYSVDKKTERSQKTKE